MMIKRIFLIIFIIILIFIVYLIKCEPFHQMERSKESKSR